MGDLRAVSEEEGVRILLRSIDVNRLVVFCGAGMSMGDPTGLPSAADLADELATEYEAVEGALLPGDFHWDLEAFARHVYTRGEFNAHVIQKVPWGDFQRSPNPAHEAAADLLLANGVRAAVSTNYDSHIEDAATSLGERDFVGALDGDQIARIPDRYKPLLKIHGCARRDRENTVWLVEQLDEEPIKSRNERSRIWAEANLRQRDLLFVGFWSDWSYLNQIFGKIISNIETPDTRKVVIVDPAEPDKLEEKAAELWQWATSSANVDFIHVEMKAETFMAELRLQVGYQFLRKLLKAGRGTYQDFAGRPAAGDLSIDDNQSSAGLYNLRRDLTGAAPNECVTTIDPAGLEVLGGILLRLLDHGAQIEGPVIRVNEETFRLVHGGNQPLNRIRVNRPGFIGDLVV